MFIAGDWGTTHLRLFLCDDERVVETRNGVGIGAITGPAEAEFGELIASWRSRYRPTSAVLCGMVGSRNGWQETAYVPCPAAFPDLLRVAGHVMLQDLDIAIVPGLSCTSPRQTPDVMRGEETQIFGAIHSHPALARGRHLLALPGTHTKWALIEDGRVLTFHTAFTGELFALLSDRSTLMLAGKAGDTGEMTDESGGFANGLRASAEPAASTLVHELFQIRSRQLVEHRTPAWARGFLSGLLLGSDVDGALLTFGVNSRVSLDRVTVIGDERLTLLYARALETRGVASTTMDGKACVIAGLRAIATRIDQQSVHVDE